MTGELPVFVMTELWRAKTRQYQ